MVVLSGAPGVSQRSALICEGQCSGRLSLCPFDLNENLQLRTAIAHNPDHKTNS